AARRILLRDGRTVRLDGGGNPARAHLRRPRPALPHARRGRRPAGGGRCLPAVLVLARRRARNAGKGRGGARAVRAAARPPQRRRTPWGGVRPGLGPPTRKLPAGGHAPRPREPPP